MITAVLATLRLDVFGVGVRLMTTPPMAAIVQEAGEEASEFSPVDSGRVFLSRVDEKRPADDDAGWSSGCLRPGMAISSFPAGHPCAASGNRADPVPRRAPSKNLARRVARGRRVRASPAFSLPCSNIRTCRR